MFKYLRLCAFLFLTTMVIYSCGGGGNKSGDNAPANPLTLNATKIVAVKSDNTFQIKGSIDGVLAGADNFTFTSDNDSSASVDDAGLVTVKENDNATITVALKSDPTITASLQVEKHTFEKFYNGSNPTVVIALDSNGDLYGWGVNDYGQVGVGNRDQQPLPQKITFPEGAKLSSMDNFIFDGLSAFALLDNGKFYAWGNNDNGKLGVNSSELNEPSPKEVILPAKLLSMDNFTFTGSNAFALLNDGSFYAWGYNGSGELGLGSPNMSEQSPKPVAFAGDAKLLSMDNFIFIDNSAFALLDNGSFYAWGGNYAGQLGVGDFTDRESPALVTFAGGAKLSSMDNFIFIDNSAFALLDNGSFYAWGYNGYGQLGVGDTTDKPSPTKITLPAKLSSMDNFTFNSDSAFALLNDGSFYAWGSNYDGELGVGDDINKASPAPVALPATLSSMDNFTISGQSAFALLNDGNFYAWGQNYVGRLGVGDTSDKQSPALVTFAGGTKLLSMGNFTFNGASGFVILSDDSFYAWGMNVDGQLGVGDTANKPSPTEIALPAPLSSMDNFTFNGASAFALLNDGSFYAWGKNDSGKLGVNSSNPSELSPAKVLIPEDEKLLSYDKFISYDMNTFFITDKGFLYSVGNGEFGQLGNGSTDNQNTPQNVW